MVEVDKPRPAVILTRAYIAGRLKNVTIAPITTTVRGIASEVEVGPVNGLEHSSVISCDNITTVPWSQVRAGIIGRLSRQQDEMLALAIMYAFDLAI